MEKHPEETKKTGVSVRKLFPALVAAAISFWFSGLYMNRLCSGLFASAALTKPEIIGAAAPFSYRIIARIIVGVALFTIPLVLIVGLKKDEQVVLDHRHRSGDSAASRQDLPV